MNDEDEYVELYDARGRMWAIECKSDGTECYLTMCDGRENNDIYEFHRIIDALTWLESEGHMSRPY